MNAHQIRTLPGVLSVDPVGSRVTCNPAPTNTDRDWLVLLNPDLQLDCFNALSLGGWEYGGSEIPDAVNTLPPEHRFQSFTLGEENVIATSSKEFHRRFLSATSVAKRLNLLNKSDRIALFQAVLYGNPAADGSEQPAYEQIAEAA